MKGQINIGLVIGWGVAIILTATGSFIASISATNSKIEKLTSSDSQQIERIAKTEAYYTDILRRLDSIDKKLEKIK